MLILRNSTKREGGWVQNKAFARVSCRETRWPSCFHGPIQRTRRSVSRLTACSHYCSHISMNVSSPPPPPSSCIYSCVPNLPAGTGFPIESRTHSTWCTTFSQKPAHCFRHCYTFLSHPRLTSLLALFLKSCLVPSGGTSPAFRQFRPTHVMQLPAARLLPSGLSVPPEDFKLDCVLTLANSWCCTLLQGFTCLQQTVEQFHFFACSFVQRAFLPS